MGVGMGGGGSYAVELPRPDDPASMSYHLTQEPPAGGCRGSEEPITEQELGQRAEPGTQEAMGASGNHGDARLVWM